MSSVVDAYVDGPVHAYVNGPVPPTTVKFKPPLFPPKHPSGVITVLKPNG